jgi:hypothetical protein
MGITEAVMAGGRDKPGVGKLIEDLAKKFAEKLMDSIMPRPEPRPVPIPVRGTRRR